MKTLYESLLDDDLDKISITKIHENIFNEWVKKNCSLNYNIEFEYNEKSNAIDIPGFLPISKRATLLPKSIKLGNVAGMSISNFRYLKNSGLPIHTDFIDTYECDVTTSHSVEYNCTQALIHSNCNCVINIEEPIYWGRKTPGVIGISCMRNERVNKIKINSNGHDIYVVWDSPWTQDSVIEQLSAKQPKTSEEALDLVLGIINIEEIEKQWKDIKVIYFNKGWVSDGFNRFSNRMITGGMNEVKRDMHDGECYIIKENGKWRAVYKK